MNTSNIFFTIQNTLTKKSWWV